MDITPIAARLNIIANSVNALKTLQPLTIEEFQADTMIQAAAERHFQVAIQAALDIAAIILADQTTQPPERYRDIFPHLAKLGVLPVDFAQKIAGMAQFRNVLVHLYMEIDATKVYQYLQHDVGDLERFAEYIAKYLGRSQTE